jgi:hypothetical protein
MVLRTSVTFSCPHAIKQISRCFVSGGKNTEISGRNSQVLRYPRQFQPVTLGKLIDCGSFPPKGSP